METVEFGHMTAGQRFEVVGLVPGSIAGSGSRALVDGATWPSGHLTVRGLPF